MAKITTKIVRKEKHGKVTLVEKEIFVNGEYEDTICEVRANGSSIGGYTSISDALAHKGEWFGGVDD